MAHVTLGCYHHDGAYTLLVKRPSFERVTMGTLRWFPNDTQRFPSVKAEPDSDDSPSMSSSAEKSVPLRILYEKYAGCLTADNMIKVTAVLQQAENQKILLQVRDFHVKNPDIKIRVLGEPMQKRKLVAELTLTNPLPTPLTGCIFMMEGAGLTEGQKVQAL
ncbi:protein-glutamine gamma-glutamyltransferase 2-like, partial [Pseudonaja textilis]|uniref:protein-glutamine gamma-glutamyltransferase 2-like n=1 Tax=Pseudonaja textilis TaxID=8673 RepID=UPI000EA922C0